ncbi:MAG: hypothetical protein EZS28_014816 [Streblomastix strix]|uniref:Uncharacterized protein n=1 Tax=Streblomastix strix TaxID=222440 RepID=A0A5J4W450_9EUKA|nr:MAG: hypothetical protein EZS28_014816 [Streblomastix strix]
MKLSEDKYKDYLVDAAKFKTRWCYELRISTVYPLYLSYIIYAVNKMILFIAKVNGHIDEYYINYCIDFGPILRTIDVITNKETIGEYIQSLN